MYAVPHWVRAHDGPYAAFLNSFLESRQVNLVDCPFAHVHVHGEALYFLIVQEEVFQTAGHTVLLCGLDIRRHHLTGQEGVFAHILEIAAIVRGACDVHARAQHDVLIAESEFLAHGIAVYGGQHWIPARCQTGERRKGHDGVICPHSRRPRVPFQFLAHAVRTVIHIQLTDAQTRHARRGELTLRMQQ